jgi:hypothetical protein
MVSSSKAGSSNSGKILSTSADGIVFAAADLFLHNEKKQREYGKHNQRNK